MESLEYVLPVEHWMQIFEKVPSRDLCNVVLASRYLNSLTSAPDLWTGIKINKEKVGHHELAQFYKIKRFKKVTQMDFSRMWRLSKQDRMRLVSGIAGSPLEMVNFSYTNLLGVRGKVLAKAFSHLQTLNLEGTTLTTNQFIDALEAIHSSPTLVNVNLASSHFGGVPTDLLSRAVCSLQTVNLGHISNRYPGFAQQFNGILEASLSSTSLVSLSLSRTCLRYHFQADLLARAVCRLQTVDLSGTELNAHQSARIVEAVASSYSLIDLNMRYIDLSGIPSDLLAKAVRRLRKVNLEQTSLTADQSSGLVESILSSTTLADVNLCGTDLKSFSADLLAKAVCSLRKVELSYMPSMTADQCAKMFQVSLSSNTLEEVTLTWVDLTGVPTGLLAKAICRLRKVHLDYSRLTSDQSTRILEASLSSNTLADLSLIQADLSEVPAELLAKAVRRLKKVNLRCTKLTPEQCIAVGDVILSSTSLQHIDLAGNEIGGIGKGTSHLFIAFKKMDHVRI